ncbi:hypothetical protein L1049_023541 [Liquidambar formosana]|uniref:X8 domain-containing protein n=1 Tax=Liquidambar formosana TaxID=63359 RepID=A0AAP0RT80_LIQFO
MLKMVWLFHFFFIYLVGLTGAGQESIEIINLYDSSPVVLQDLSHTGLHVAVSISHSDLNEVSSSVLMAESWLRAHVLSNYPATKITTIVVGNSVLCHKNQEDKLGLVLPSLKNIYHSLKRWGLEKDIKVSASFSSNCMHPYSAVFRDEIAETVIKPLLHFLHTTSSTYSVNPPPNFSPVFDERVSLVSSHSESMKKLGFFELKNQIKVIIGGTKERNPMSRKLSFLDSKFVDPFPARPTPLPEIAPSPIHSSIGYPTPANVIKNPLPPLAAISSPPSMSFSFPPELPPLTDQPASPPFGFTLPPCNPLNAAAPVPSGAGVEKGLWCVAKPSVPTETLQEAMDYACGAGGADCEEIKPHGSCYNPDTLVAHASYAFNNYWQKNKINGGTCSFGGTAMLINADPSFLHCQFVLS